MRIYRFERTDRTGDIFVILAASLLRAEAYLVLYLRDAGEEIDLDDYDHTVHRGNRVLRFGRTRRIS